MAQLARFLFARPWAALGALASLGLSDACVPADEACVRARSCAPTGGEVSIVEHWQGGSMGGTDATSASGGEGGFGGEPPGEPKQSAPAEREEPTAAPGDECSPDGRYACAAHATREQLVCENGYYVPYDTCPVGQRCDNRPETAGLCQPVIPECEDHEPSDLVCRGLDRIVCGPDLVTEKPYDTCSDECWQGKCVECMPGTPATCEFNTRRGCTSEGMWAVESCPAATPQCSNGICGLPPSCLELEPTCGIGEDEQCCASPVIPEGSIGDAAMTQQSSFRLDRFEVTVGRFRAFRAAWDGGWRPEAGSGKHVHLNDGLGLVNRAQPEEYEPGWVLGYEANIAPTDSNLIGGTGPNTPPGTWSILASALEERPINRVNVFEAYAFCIWDGGFLPTTGEWKYAAQGGSELRTYPWGPEEPEANFDLAIYGCLFPEPVACPNLAVDSDHIASVGTARGEGLFHQLDLIGNVNEWMLGSSPCSDCVTTPIGLNVGWPIRGGAFNDPLLDAQTMNQTFLSQLRAIDIGFRCARVP